MHALMLQCDGALQEVEAVGEWYDDCVRRAAAYLNAEASNDIEEVEALSHVLSGDLMHHDGSMASAASEEWAVEAVLRRRTVKGQPQYLVRWRGHAQPSWEWEEDLEDQGYGGWLERFLEDEAARVRRGGLPVAAAPARCVPRDAPIPPLHQRGGFSPEHLWPDFKFRIQTAFMRAHTDSCISRIQNIVDPMRAEEFMRQWQCRDSKDAVVPLMVFHCTAEKNVPDIVANGLVIPGTTDPNVKVVHGSAYGVGIYTSKGRPFTEYGGNYSFVCAGLIGKHYTSARDIHDIVVFSDARLVLPCFLVEWHRRSGCCYCASSYVADMYQPEAPWPPPNPRPYDRPGVGRPNNVRNYYPPPVVKEPGTNCSNWAENAKVKPISKRQLKQCARRVKALYKEGALRQSRGGR
eukprot:EG_transcript_11217